MINRRSLLGAVAVASAATVVNGKELVLERGPSDAELSALINQTTKRLAKEGLFETDNENIISVLKANLPSNVVISMDDTVFKVVSFYFKNKSNVNFTNINFFTFTRNTPRAS